MSLFAGFIVWALLFLVYFAPTFEAYRKKKLNREAILLVNLIFGWTVIGWIIALIWSATNDNRHV